jgi:Putative beta-barrel porin-2, OmpL-like. bbp2
MDSRKRRVPIEYLLSDRVGMPRWRRTLAASAPAGSMRVSAMWEAIGALALILALATLAAAQPPDGEPPQDGGSQPPASQPADPAAVNPWRNVTFGATFEGYYQYDWNKPPDRVIPLRAYDTRANTFGIQQAAFVVDASPDVDAGRRYGLRADLQGGQATETVQGSPANEPRPDVYRNIWQVYGTYLFPVGDNGLQTDFGKFASMLGYETNYAKDNQAFSRAYLFNFLPFYHTGLRVTFPVSDKVSVLYMLTNGIQQTEDFNDYKSSHFAAVVKPVSQVSWTVNYYFGQEQPDGGHQGGPDGFFRVFDTYVTYTATSALTLGLDANYVTNEVTADADSLSLQGVGAYARYQVNTPVGLGVRWERLDDEGLFGGIDQILQEITLTAEYKLADGFLVRGEFRSDWSDQSFFPGSGGAGDLRDHQNTLLLGGVWVIGTKKGAW